MRNLSPMVKSGNLDFDDVPCGQLILTPEGKILRANETLLQWTGYSNETITDKGLEDITPPGTGLYFKLIVFPLVRLQGYANEISLDILQAGKPARSCLLNATARKDEAGDLTHLSVVLFPISDRKKYEVEILQQKKVAEALSEEREQILDAQRRIMSIIGHDTRAPLVSINNMIRLAAEGKISADEVVPYFGMMSSQLDATLVLIANLMDWAKAQFDTRQVQQDPVALTELVDEVCGLLEPNASAKGISLNARIAQEISVKKESSIVSFIVRNLVNNAIKFTAAGSVTISARHEGDQVFISVSDTGIGMDLQQLQNFRTGDIHSTPGTSTEQGSGMGLMLVRQYLLQLHGELEVESQPDQGTVVTVRLPVVMFQT